MTYLHTLRVRLLYALSDFGDFTLLLLTIIKTVCKPQQFGYTIKNSLPRVISDFSVTKLDRNVIFY